MALTDLERHRVRKRKPSTVLATLTAEQTRAMFEFIKSRCGYCEFMGREEMERQEAAAFLGEDAGPCVCKECIAKGYPVPPEGSFVGRESKA